ncbi:MAG: xanthine dehydrogenase family protein subunit M [Gemmatimonadetes bacterium]|nr:xanthine dehydrogenase family protein subunit M [Gemmatimonadota bacterium]MCY3678313.1 xanthine dehydrogenase family protein subunit M [Gemmatimonadota bacterium]MXY96967.1 xanthine dehydrogenase family protein subunit M [Gemmatimonadota bacterium]MYE93173.1 xanthine dehydrogenase family protein subunit M [Gemmatimonadota bacterium]MYJ09885.1 xanthine dehydrogenase family protein subunit M [Gemmatimonadota bacterium]
MAVIRDMIPPFELYQPAGVDDAVRLMDEHGSDGWVLAGGLDTFDWFKDRIKRPAAVIDLGGVDEIRGITGGVDGGLDIGAMTSLTDVAEHADVQSRYPLLADAAGLVATPQIRNQGTLGGNIVQDTRCWYYRSGWPCYRAGGNICYAATRRSMNREHCIVGADRCVAVNPSDTAPALVALDAEMVVASTSGERTYPAVDFFIGPDIDIERMTVLEPGDLLTRVVLPVPWEGARWYFEKIRDRKSWDFSLVSVASMISVQGGVIQDARIVVNSIAPYPVRMGAVEAAIRGREPSDETGQMAGEIAVEDARALRHNDYKIALTRNLVRRSIRDAA